MKCSRFLLFLIFSISFVPVYDAANSRQTDNAIARDSLRGERSGIAALTALPAAELEHGRILISEFRPAGPGDGTVSSASDEYIELFNPQSEAVLLNNQVVVQRGNKSNSDAVVFTFDTDNTIIIPGYGHFLIGKNMSRRKNPLAIQNVPVDGTSQLTTGMASNGGGIALRNGTVGIKGQSEFIDAVAYISNSGSGPLNLVEGSPIDLGSRTGGVTLERKPGFPAWNGFDTHSNTADFIIRGTTEQDAQPQNMTSPFTPPPPSAGSGDVTVNPAVVPCGSSEPIVLTVTGDGINTLTTIVVTLPSEWAWDGRIDNIILTGEGCIGARCEIAENAPYRIAISGVHITAQRYGIITLAHLLAPERAGTDTFYVQTAGAGEETDSVAIHPSVRVDDFDGSGTVSIAPATLDAGIQTELMLRISSDEFQLSSIQCEIPAEWQWSGLSTDIVLSDSGLAGTRVGLSAQGNGVVITIDSASIVGTRTGKISVMNVHAPSYGGTWRFIVRTKAERGKTLEPIDDLPRITVTPHIVNSFVPRMLVSDATTGTPGAGTTSVVGAGIIGLCPSTTYSYKIRALNANILTWSRTDSTWGSDTKSYSQLSRFSASETGFGEFITGVKCLSQTDTGEYTLIVRLRALGDSVNFDMNFPTTVRIMKSDSVGWLEGHLFADAQRDTPLCGTIVAVCNADGMILATAQPEDNDINEGNVTSQGFFRCAVPRMDITAIRSVTQNPPDHAVYLRSEPPWDVISGRTIDVDRTVCRFLTSHDTIASDQPIIFGSTGVRMRLREISRNGFFDVMRVDAIPYQSNGCRYQCPGNEFDRFTHLPFFWQIMSSDSTNDCTADLVFSYPDSIDHPPSFIARRLSGDTTQWNIIPREQIKHDSAARTMTALGAIPYGEWSFVRECNLPKDFQLLLPPDKSVIDSLPIVFCWQPSASKGESDSVSYTLRMSNGPDSMRINGIRDTSYSYIPADLKPKVDYRWDVLATNGSGTKQCASAFVFQIQESSNVSRGGTVPGEYFLSCNYPNPFNSTTQFIYGLPRDAHVRIEIFDILGRLVMKMVDDDRTAGIHSVSFGGSTIATGIYWIQMKAGKFRGFQKMVFLK